MNVEEQLGDAQVRLAALEDLVETLNRTIYRQQTRLDEIESLCMALVRRLKDAETGSGDQSLAHERPPHY
jgi:SlyX protein